MLIALCLGLLLLWAIGYLGILSDHWDTGWDDPAERRRAEAPLDKAAWVALAGSVAGFGLALTDLKRNRPVGGELWFSRIALASNGVFVAMSLVHAILVIIAAHTKPPAPVSGMAVRWGPQGRCHAGIPKPA
jgi:hypothetical protein